MRSALPDLESGKAFEAWVQAAYRRSLPLEELIRLVEQEASELAYLRAAILALDLPGIDTSRAKRLVLKARSSCSEGVKAYADALLCYIGLRDTRATSGPSDVRGAPALIPALEGLLEDIRTNKGTSLSTELEARLNLILSNAYQQVGNFTKAERHASQALMLAEALELPLTQGVAVSYLSFSLAGLGRANDSLELVNQELKREPVVGSPRVIEEHERLMSSLLFSLGDDESALS